MVLKRTVCTVLSSITRVRICAQKYNIYKPTNSRLLFYISVQGFDGSSGKKLNNLRQEKSTKRATIYLPLTLETCKYFNCLYFYNSRIVF